MSENTTNEEETEVLSDDENAVYTGETYSQVEASASCPSEKRGSFDDPDATCFIDTNSLQVKPRSSDTSKDLLEDSDAGSVVLEVSDLSNGCSQEASEPVASPQIIDESPSAKSKGKSECDSPLKDRDVGNVVLQESNLSNGCSQESTQPITPSQVTDQSPPAESKGKSDSYNGSIDETFELTPTQDIQNTLSPTEDCLESESFNRTSTLEVKPSGDVPGLAQNDKYSLRTVSSAVSTSSSSR